MDKILWRCCTLP